MTGRRPRRHTGARAPAGRRTPPGSPPTATTSSLADVRWYLDGRSGRTAYAAATCPGAVFVDLDAVLAGTADGDGRPPPAPGPAAFAAAMAELGIGDGDTVVAYDDDGGVMAARLVWMLRATGHGAALLDGGIAAWDRAARDRAVRRGRPRPSPRAVAGGPARAADDAADAANVVLDARARERYTGQEEPVDPRAGHIPGARSLPPLNVDAAGRLLPVGGAARPPRRRGGGRLGARGRRTAAPASPRATPCSCSSTPDSLPDGCIPAPGRRGAAIPRARSRPARTRGSTLAPTG